MPEVDTSRIPPAALQAIQQSGVQGGDITSILAQLAQMSPEEVSAALAQLGVNVDPETLQSAASDWVDQAAEKSTGSSTSPPDTSGDAAQQSEGGGDDSDEGAPAMPPPTPQQQQMPADGGDVDVGVDTDEAMDAYAQAPAGGGQGGGGIPAAVRMRAGGGGTGPARVAGAPPMDDAIMAALMDQAQVNSMPNVPAAAKFAALQRPQMPHSPSATASDDPRMRNMIGNIYRSVAMQNAGADRVAAPRTLNPRNARPR